MTIVKIAVQVLLVIVVIMGMLGLIVGSVVWSHGRDDNAWKQMIIFASIIICAIELLVNLDSIIN